MDGSNGALYFDSDIDKKKFIRGLDDMERRAVEFGNNVTETGKISQRAIDRLAGTIGNGNLVRSLDSAGKRVEQFTNSSVSSFNSARASFDQFANGVNSGRFNGGLSSLETRMAQMAQSAARGTQQAGAQFDNLGGKAEESAQKIQSSFGGLSATIAGFLTIQAASSFVSQLISIRGEFQQLSIAYTTILGNKAQADKLMADTVELAATTPFSLREVAISTKQLLAYGVGAGEVTKTLRMLGDVAAGVSQPIGDIAYLYGTIKTQGRAYQQDINQFTGRGIPIIAELAKQFGVAESEIRNLTEAGKIGFPEIDKAFKSLTQNGGIFFNLMGEQAKSLSGQWSNLGDAFDQMINSIGQSNEGVLGAGIAGVTTLVKNYDQVLNVLTVMIAAYGTYRAALALTMLAEKAKVLMQVRDFATGALVTTGTRTMTAAEILSAASKRALAAAQSFLNTTMLANPYVLIATLLATAAAATYFMGEKTLELKDSTELLTEANENNAASMKEQEGEVRSLAKTINDQNVAESTRLKAYERLKEIAPDILQGLTFQEAKTKDLTAAVSEYVSTLQSRIRLESLQKAYGAALKQLDDAGNLVKDRNKDLKDMTGYAAATLGATKLREAYETMQDAQNTVIDIEKKIGGEIDKSGKNSKVAIQARIKELQTAQQFYDANSAAYKANEDEIKRLQSALSTVGVKTQQLTNAQKILNAKSIEELDDLLKSFGDKKNKAETQQMRDSLAKDIILAQQRKALFDKTAKDHKAGIQQQKKDESEYLKDKEKLLSDITKAEDEAFLRTQTGNEREKAEARQKYDSLRDSAKRLKLGQGPLTRIDRVEENVLGNIQYRYDTELLKSSLDKAKDLYEDFEQYKIDFGVEKAKEKYKQQLNVDKSYLDVLKDEQIKLLYKAPGTLTGPEQERIKMLTEAIADGEKTLEKKRSDTLKRIYQETESYKQKEKNLEIKFQSDMAALKSDKTINEDELKKRQEILSKQHELELQGIRKMAFEETKIAQDMANDLFFMTREQLKEQIKRLKEDLKDPSLSPAQKATGQKALAQATELFKEDFANTTKDIIGYTEDVAGSLYSWADALEGANDQLAYTVSQLANTTGLLTDYFKANAQVAAGIASGDPTAIASGVTGLIGVAGKLFTMNKKVKEMNRAAREEVKKFYDSALQGEREYQALLRQRDLDQAKRSKTSYQSLVNQLEAFKKQAPEIQAAYDAVFASLQNQEFIQDKQSKHGTWFRKAKTWDVMATLAGSDFERLEQLYLEGRLKDQALADFEALKKLREELEAAGLNVQDLQAQITEMLTGTSVEGLADALADLFKNGQLAAKDFGKTFEEIVGQAILNSFKYSVIEKAMAPLFDQLASITAGGAIPTSDQVAKFIEDATAIGETLGGQWTAIVDGLKGAGMDLFGQGTPDEALSSNTIKASLTEDTANRALGIWTGMYDINKNILLAIQTGNLACAQHKASEELNRTTWQAIETNTGNTVNRLETVILRLDAIIINTKPVQSSRDIGR